MEIGLGFRERYINPFTDFGFKKLFGTEANKELLMNFLQTLLQREGQIVELHYIDYKNNEQTGNTIIDRSAVFDIYCITDRGERFIVEMQKAKQNYFKDRTVFYSTFPIQEQARQGGDWNFKLNAVYTVGILDFVFNEDKDEEDKFAYYVKLSDIETHKVFYDKLMFVYLELPKFTKTEDQLETLFDKWMYVLKNLSKLQDRPKALQERVFKKLFQVAEIEKFSYQEKQAYENSLKVYRDLKNVIDTAVEEAVTEAVKEAVKEKDEMIRDLRNMIDTAVGDAVKEKEEAIREKDAILARTIEKLWAMGLSAEQISETTGMSVSRIMEIKKIL